MPCYVFQYHTLSDIIIFLVTLVVAQRYQVPPNAITFLTGITKRLLWLWLKSPKLHVRLPGGLQRNINETLTSFKDRMATEFVRKPRSISEYERWKATEFYSFLLYTGPLALYRNVDEAVYKNFLLLSCAIHILCSRNLHRTCNDYAQQLLVKFVKHFGEIYGADQLVYTVHNVVHLPQDVVNHGPLQSFSAFQFENYLGRLKRLVRKRNKVLEQVILRLGEAAKLPRKPKVMQNEPVLRKKHNNGPVPNDRAYRPCQQYAEVLLNDRLISTKNGDNCFRVDDHIVTVENIISSEETIYVVYSVFRHDDAFFTYPIDSRRLDIHKLSRLGATLYACELRCVSTKYVLLPLNHHSEVALPMSHTL